MATEVLPAPTWFKRHRGVAAGALALFLVGGGAAVAVGSGDSKSGTDSRTTQTLDDTTPNTYPPDPTTAEPTDKPQAERLVESEYWTSRPSLITAETPEARVDQTLALLEYCWNTGLGCDALAENGGGVHQSATSTAAQIANDRLTGSSSLLAVKLSRAAESPVTVVSSGGGFETVELSLLNEAAYLDLSNGGRPTVAHPGTTEATPFRLRLQYNEGIQAWQLDCIDNLSDSENVAC